MFAPSDGLPVVSESMKMGTTPGLETLNRGRLGNLARSAVARPEPSNTLPIYLVLIGIFLPPVQLYIGGAKFTPARIAITLLLIPALSILLRGGRHAVSSDFFACMGAIWLIGASFATDGFN